MGSYIRGRKEKKKALRNSSPEDLFEIDGERAKRLFLLTPIERDTVIEDKPTIPFLDCPRLPSQKKSSVGLQFWHFRDLRSSSSASGFLLEKIPLARGVKGIMRTEKIS